MGLPHLHPLLTTMSETVALRLLRDMVTSMIRETLEVPLLLPLKQLVRPLIVILLASLALLEQRIDSLPCQESLGESARLGSVVRADPL